MALQKGLCSASNDEELSSVLLLIKDVEMWMPEVVQLALQLCFRAKDQRAQFLPNLGKILHYQNEANSGDDMMIETDVTYQLFVKLITSVLRQDNALWEKRFKNRQNFDSYCKKVNPNLGHLE